MISVPKPGDVREDATWVAENRNQACGEAMRQPETAAQDQQG